MLKIIQMRKRVKSDAKCAYQNRRDIIHVFNVFLEVTQAAFISSLNENALETDPSLQEAYKNSVITLYSRGEQKNSQ